MYMREGGSHSKNFHLLLPHGVYITLFRNTRENWTEDAIFKLTFRNMKEKVMKLQEEDSVLLTIETAFRRK